MIVDGRLVHVAEFSDNIWSEVWALELVALYTKA